MDNGRTVDYAALGRLEGKVEVILDRVVEAEAEIRAIHDEVVNQRPRNGEITLLGLRWGRGSRLMGALLLGLLIFIGQHVWLSLAHIDGELAVIRGEMVEVVAFKELGARAISKDLEPLYDCMIHRFSDRLSGLEQGSQLAEPDPTMVSVTRDCLERLRRGRDELRARQ